MLGRREAGRAAGLSLASFREEEKMGLPACSWHFSREKINNRKKTKREIKERIAPCGLSYGGKKRSRKSCRPVAGNFRGRREEEGFAGL